MQKKPKTENMIETQAAKPATKPQRVPVRNENIKPFSPPRVLYYPTLSFLNDSLMLTITLSLVAITADITISVDWIASPGVPFVFFLIGAMWMISMILQGALTISRTASLWEEMMLVTKASVLALVFGMGALYLIGWILPQSVVLHQFAIGLIGLLAWRMIYSTVRYFNFVSTHNFHSRVLVIGSAHRISSVITMLRQVNSDYISVAGVLSSNRIFAFSESLLGNFGSDLEQIIAENNVDTIVMAFTHADNDVARKMLNKCLDLPVESYVFPDYMDVRFSIGMVNQIEELGFVNVTPRRLSRIDLFLKRSLDLVAGSVALLLAAPAMAMIALAIKKESDGPILFIQERMGAGKQKFPIFKFRSMRINADSELETVSERDDVSGRITHHKRPDDPRVTRIGKFIRKTSLDELPQIFNVLRGDMSLVGPRPELMKLVAEYEPWQDERFRVRQGITGWWQVNGRSENPCHLSTHQDVEYINNFSFLLDIQIILMTVPALLKGKGAF